MVRRLALAAVLCLAPAIPAAAQSSSHSQAQPSAPASHDSTQCATLHAMMVQHMVAMGMDSAQITALHATLQDAIAHGASPDSLHHALLQSFMQSMHGAGGNAGGNADGNAGGNADGNMAHMQLDSAHVAAIHACLASHATQPSAAPEKRR